MSALPEISNVAASNSPVIVIFLPPVISIFSSATSAFEAITVPAVMPSSISSSDSTKAALPKLIPLALTIPSLRVTKSIITPFDEVFSDIVSTLNSAPIISPLPVYLLKLQMGFLQMPCRCNHHYLQHHLHF